MAAVRLFSHYLRFGLPRGGDRQRLPWLERLLARADGPSAIDDWRAEAFRVIAADDAALPGIGAAALFAAQGVSVGAAVFVASPVHYLAEMSNVRLPLDGLLSSTPAEAGALALDFNRVWNDAAVRLVAGDTGRLFFVFDALLSAVTHDPELATGLHIENFLPAGPDAATLRRLMSETEMWLFEHAVNRERSAAGQPPINGLWPWGGGAALAASPVIRGAAAGDDVFVDAFRRAEGDAAQGAVWVLRQPPDAHALAASLDALRRGAIASIELSAGACRFTLRARHRRRFWRRSKPWWESLA